MMNIRLFVGILLMILGLTACQQFDDLPTRPADPFQNIQYLFSYGESSSKTFDKEIVLPEKLINGGVMSAVDLGFSGNFNDIDGNKLLVRWQGSIALDKDEVRVIQTSRNGSGSVEVRIDGELVQIGIPIIITKGTHTIDVRYMPRHFADKFVLNFLPKSEIIADDNLEKWRDRLNISRNDVIAFVVSSYRPSDNQPQMLTLPESKKPLILVLNNEELNNWHIDNPHNTPVKALVLLHYAGVVTGSNAPIYRFLNTAFYSEITPENCQCIGGTQFSCSGGETGSFPDIQEISQKLFNRPPHFIGKSDWNKDKAVLLWQSFQAWQEQYDEHIVEVRKGKERCGGSMAFSFDNAHSGSLKNDENSQKTSWAQKLGITSIPENAFSAVYFNQDNPQQVVFRETVPNISINYAYDYFQGLDSQKFMGLWIGKKTFEQDTPMSLQFDFSWAQLRIWVDGKIIFSQRHGENGTPQEQTLDYTFTRGEHTIEVEYINHWHTTNFALNFIPQQTIETSRTMGEKIRQANYSVVRAEVYESAKLNNHLKVQIPNTSKPTVLLLSSHRKVFWEVESNPNLAMIVIQDKTGEVKADSYVPVIRVEDIPHLPVEAKFYIYDTKDDISADMFKSVESSH